MKGVFLKLNPKTADHDLEELRRRERRRTERVVADTPHLGAETHFWIMGSNLDEYDDLRKLAGHELLRGLAVRARQVTALGPDGASANEYIRRVHEFDPGDVLTARLAQFLDDRS